MKIENGIKEYACSFGFGEYWIHQVELLLKIWSKEPFTYPATWICYNATLRLNDLTRIIQNNRQVDNWFKEYSNSVNKMMTDICLECRKDREYRTAPSEKFIRYIELFKEEWSELKTK